MTLKNIKEFATSRFWSQHHADEDLVSWMHEPLIRRYINECVGGSPDIWPMEWFRDRLGATQEWGLSVGCGLGALERDVVAKRICRRVVGVDISVTALEKAGALADEAGLAGIEYVKGSFNEEFWRRDQRFDIIFFHQAMHHVESLELCVDHMASILKPGGLLFLDEYIGPSRHEWKTELLVEAEQVYQALPKYCRRRRRLKLPLDWRDPSEAIRSAEIMSVVKLRFEVIEQRDYGGNFLALIHPHLTFEKVSEHEKGEIIGQIMAEERRLLEEGAGSFYTVFYGRLAG